MDKDISAKACLSDNTRYADLINGLLLQGRQMVRAEDLHEADTQAVAVWTTVGRETDVRGSSRKRKKKKQELRRDLHKKVAFGVNFVVIGVENQSEVHYTEPLRVMSYDAAEYRRQTRSIGRRVKNDKGVSKAEFLSGFRKEDKLLPCITIVLYYGEDWDGSRDLHGLLDFTDVPEELKAYINNYQAHIFSIKKMDNTDVFRTDLKQIFDFIRYAEDKKKLRELVENDPLYKNMDEDAYDMVVACTGTKELLEIKKYHGKDGKIDMCKGLYDWIEEERMEGKSEGMREGMRAFVEDYLEEGREPEVIAEKLVRRFGLSYEEAQEYVNDRLARMA